MHDETRMKERKKGDGRKTCLSGHARNFERVVHHFPSRKFVGCALHANIRQLHDQVFVFSCSSRIILKN